MLTKDAVKLYLLEIEIRRYTPKTIRSYTNSLNFFFAWQEKYNHITLVENLTNPHIKAFVASMLRENKKATYINTILKVLRSFLIYCVDEGYLQFDFSKFKWLKEEKVIIQTFTNMQAKQLISFYRKNDYNSVKNKSIIMTLFETGIRCYELCCLRLDDVQSGYLIIHGKNHKQRVVPITPLLEKQFVIYKRVREKYFDCKVFQREYFFLSRTGRQLTNSAIEHIIKCAGEGMDRVRVSPHTLRHFYAQAQLKNGLDIYSLSRLLGHENISITQRYLQGLRDKEILNSAMSTSTIMNL